MYLSDVDVDTLVEACDDMHLAPGKTAGAKISALLRLIAADHREQTRAQKRNAARNSRHGAS